MLWLKGKGCIGEGIGVVSESGHPPGAALSCLNLNIVHVNGIHPFQNFGTMYYFDLFIRY